MDDFYEDDELAEQVTAEFERGPHGVTEPPTQVYGCEHLTVAGPLLGTPTSYLCSCELSPVSTS